MTPKKLEPGSKLNPYDMDGDGVVTDEEIEKSKEIREFEDQSRKHMAQLRIARWTLIGMGVSQSRSMQSHPCKLRLYLHLLYKINH